MNWITNYVRPKIRALVAPREDIPDNLWDKCTSCGHMIFHRELEELLRVCPNCGHHMRIGPERRMEVLFDDGAYEKIELPQALADPLKFRDRERYSERLKKARTKTGQQDAIRVGHGHIGSQPAVVAAFDFSFMGGSMGLAVGEGLVTAAREAARRRAALIAVPASGGARMQEGILSLMQMPRSVIAVQMVRDEGLPYIVLLTDPTTGGVSASFAMLGDVQIAEPGAVIGFAGARVIEETIRETLPPGFQRAEYLLEHGMIDMVVPRSELRETMGRLLGHLMNSPAVRGTAAQPVAAATPAEPSKVDIAAEESDQSEAATAGNKEAGKKDKEAERASDG
ncbi:acetyl-CoA carboxylase, carboxyltransferase subunit beta [Aquibaculum arenosum]|uniref:Acetyl-coenzyme A carboxylase carboxyl transferase subunit beta n=1 Tax=Aquibaculum arenosum TaxID=3032591 RepID=A0ABT5YHW8_9PROT|nr:acetyl-CoA carboxylase, carboxyltransferase subunit beta [Fodinicurvata sp. CAU 1616]MDF2094508.1 acetyl-CoA carboxylase, carboxyltransferase subunit beta [Fodinicurvata sp. CAU 1616]